MANDSTEMERRRRGRPKTVRDDEGPKPIQALNRGLTVLRTLADNGDTTLSDLAGVLGQPPSTLYRILTTLQTHDMAKFEEDTQTWDIGPGAFRIGSSYLRRTGVLEQSHAAMRQLMQDTGETANLGILQDDEVLFLSQVETRETIRAFFPPGTRSPMHATGIGKVLLAHLAEENLSRFLERNALRSYTENTLSTPDDLHRDLAAIRDRGYSVDNEERTSGMRCVAAAIFDAGGEPIAGISISGPSSRIPTDRLGQFGDRVMRAARQVTERLGGRIPE